MGYALLHAVHDPHYETSDTPSREAHPDQADAASNLSDLEQAVLRLENQFPRHSARKNERIRRDLRISTTRYYQILGTLIEKPEALAFDPTLVARLRRLQHTRASERLARREIRQSLSRATQEKIR